MKEAKRGQPLRLSSKQEALKGRVRTRPHSDTLAGPCTFRVLMFIASRALEATVRS
jgi:hypothetical protein